MTRRALFPSPVHRRLAPLTAAAFFGGIALWVPVEKLFLAEIGFTPQTIGVMAAAYAAVVPLLEIPSGILADRWSRRGVLLIGNAGMVRSACSSAGSAPTSPPTSSPRCCSASTSPCSPAPSTPSSTTPSWRRPATATGSSRSSAESAWSRAPRWCSARWAEARSPHSPRLASPTSRRCRSCVAVDRVPARLPRAAPARGGRDPVAPRARRGHLRGRSAHDRRLRAGRRTARPHLDPHPGRVRVRPAVAGRRRRRRRGVRTRWAGLMASLGIGGALAGRVRLERSATRAVLVALLLGGTATLLVSSHTVVVTVAQIVVAVLSVVIGIFLTRRAARRRDIRRAIGRRLGRRCRHLGDLHPVRDRVRRRQRTLERARRRVDARRPRRRHRVPARRRHPPRHRRRPPMSGRCGHDDDLAEAAPAAAA